MSINSSSFFSHSAITIQYPDFNYVYCVLCSTLCRTLWIPFDGFIYLFMYWDFSFTFLSTHSKSGWEKKKRIIKLSTSFDYRRAHWHTGFVSYRNLVNTVKNIVVRLRMCAKTKRITRKRTRMKVIEWRRGEKRECKEKKNETK